MSAVVLCGVVLKFTHTHTRTREKKAPPAKTYRVARALFSRGRLISEASLPVFQRGWGRIHTLFCSQGSGSLPGRGPPVIHRDSPPRLRPIPIGDSDWYLKQATRRRDMSKNHYCGQETAAIHNQKHTPFTAAATHGRATGTVPVCPVCVRSHTDTHSHSHTHIHTMAGTARGRFRRATCPW